MIDTRTGFEYVYIGRMFYITNVLLGKKKNVQKNESYVITNFFKFASKFMGKRPEDTIFEIVKFLNFKFKIKHLNNDYIITND